jgi:hypothetical protein
MLMVCYFTVLLRVEVRREEEFAYARGASTRFRKSVSFHPSRPTLLLASCDCDLRSQSWICKAHIMFLLIGLVLKIEFSKLIY